MSFLCVYAVFHLNNISKQILSKVDGLAKRYKEKLTIYWFVNKRQGPKASAHFEFITMFFMTALAWNIGFFSGWL